MKEFNHVIADPEGVHARPAGELVKLAKNYQSSISIIFDGRVGDCKRVFTIMALGIKCGNTVTFAFDGDDEDAAMEAFKDFVTTKL